MIAVVDYGIGNLRSAEKALQWVGGDARLTPDPAAIEEASGVVLPGVGAFGRCMEALRESGLDKAAVAAVERGTPFLGICIGMQLLYQDSEEDPGAPGLGLLAGTIRRLPDGVKRPQMQWNRLDEAGRPSGMLDGLGSEPFVYFDHSYAAEPSEDVVATCDYGGPVAAAIDRDNIWATQFHPEKSAAVGLRLLANFVDRCRVRS